MRATKNKYLQQFPQERVRAQYLVNAKGLERMYNKAVSTGKKVNGFTAEYLKSKTDEFYKLAQNK